MRCFVFSLEADCNRLMKHLLAAVAKLAVTSRLSGFLPQMKKSNDELQSKVQEGQAVTIEQVNEEDGGESGTAADGSSGEADNGPQMEVRFQLAEIEDDGSGSDDSDGEDEADLSLPKAAPQAKSSLIQE